jgi:hypothetical protein
MLHDQKPGARSKLVRPQTAATTTKTDEARIKKKLDFFEQLERKLEDDIEEFKQQRKDPFDDKKYEDKGRRLTKQMVLDAANCDDLDQVQTLVLRDQ